MAVDGSVLDRVRTILAAVDDGLTITVTHLLMLATDEPGFLAEAHNTAQQREELEARRVTALPADRVRICRVDEVFA